MNSLEKLRNMVGPYVVGLLWVNALLTALHQIVAAEQFQAMPVIAQFLVAALATANWAKDRTGANTRIISSIAHAVSVSILVYAFEGSGLQIDIHMYFFASLAICAAWIDWKAVVAYAGVVALHHVFDTPDDRLIWDVGHQAYPHKILTGRRDRIRTLRAEGGLSG